jgi:RNA polymerase sigma-70 factor, ECF subfamily
MQATTAAVGHSPDQEPATSDLVARLRSGDAEACREMIDLYAARILRVLLRLRDPAFDAEDVLQETWIRACQAARDFREEASLKTWLDRIALNAAAMARRKARAGSRGGGAAVVRIDRETDVGGEAGPLVPAPDAVEDAVLWRETLAELATAVAALPSGLRDVLVLRDLQGASVREAATELGISEDAVKQRLHRARGRLRTALQHLAVAAP